jgi:hypothetical protein
MNGIKTLTSHNRSKMLVSDHAVMAKNPQNNHLTPGFLLFGMKEQMGLNARVSWTAGYIINAGRGMLVGLRDRLYARLATVVSG